jgi:DNA-binding transcriptional MerR regulator
MQRTVLKVGVVSKRTGVTVRTLRYYEEIGLLSPSERTEGRHRLYTARDLARLQQIKSLQHLGFSLEEVRDCLERPEYSPLRVVELQLTRLRQQIELEQRLCRRLEALAMGLRKTQECSVEELLQIIEGITMFEKHFTAEQMEKIQERGRQLGPERIREVEAEWPRLIAEVRAEMQKGTDAASERVQGLAKRWTELVHEFTGGDPGIEAGVRSVYRGEPSVRERSGLDPTIIEYMGRACAAASGGSS